MKHIVLLLTALSVCAQAQVFTFTREQMTKYTAKNPYERFEDGRPKVPDALLERFQGLSSEEVWGVLNSRQYRNQWEGNWQILHPEKKLVGRAVTAVFMPVRPDVMEVMNAEAKALGFSGSQNQRVIDRLQAGDVIVVDLFGKVEGGTFVGDNLATYIAAITKAGAVIDGGIRDLQGIFPIDMGLYFRGAHPTAIQDVMLVGYNIPVRIGKVTVMPGDVVFGDREGVTFCPPHLVEDVLKRAEETHVHDEWTQEKLKSGKYKSSEIYGSPRDPALKKEYQEYRDQRLGKKP